MEQGTVSAAFVDEACSEQVGGALRCSWTARKGRILSAGRSFCPGAIILKDPPMMVVTEPHGCELETLEACCRRRAHELPLEPLWYWLGLATLTEEQRTGMGEFSNNLPPAPSCEAQQKVLLLYQGDEEGSGGNMMLAAAEVLIDELQLNGVDAVLFHRLVKAWMLNCFEYSEDTPKSYALYFLPSFMSHSCGPSAVWALDAEGAFVLRARADIEQHSEITISYLSEEMLLDMASERQEFLLRTKGFWCCCVRCLPGRPDLSRGFCCPVEKCGGSVFCWVPVSLSPERNHTRIRSAPSGSPTSAAAAALAGAACTRCSRSTSRREADDFLRQERRLLLLLRRWERESPRGRLREEVADNFAKSLDRVFAQHVVAERVRGHLAAVYDGLQCLQRAEELVEQRAAFQRAGFPGCSGALAWTLESLADLRLLHIGMRTGDLLTKARSPAVLRPLLNDELARRAAAVLPLYQQALVALKMLFGDDHEYFTSVARKHAAIRGALQDMAPGALA